MFCIPPALNASRMSAKWISTARTAATTWRTREPWRAPRIDQDLDLSRIGADLHTRLARDLATAAVWAPVDRHAALEANPHPAQRPARLSTYGLAKAAHPGHGDRRGHHRARGHCNR